LLWLAAVLKRQSRHEAADEAAEEMLERRREVVAEMTTRPDVKAFPSPSLSRHEVIEADQTAPAARGVRA